MVTHKLSLLVFVHGSSLEKTIGVVSSLSIQKKYELPNDRASEVSVGDIVHPSYF